MNSEEINISAEELEEIRKSQDAAKYGIFLASRKKSLAALVKEMDEIRLCISKHQQNVDYYLSLRDNTELVEMLGGQKAYDDFDSKVALAKSKIAEFEAKLRIMEADQREIEVDIYNVLKEDVSEVETEGE